MLNRPLLPLLLLTVVLVVACSPQRGPDSSWAHRDQYLSALNDLTRLAGIEQQHLDPIHARFIAPPAMIAMFVQRDPDADDEQLDLTLQDVFEVFADRAVLPSPPTLEGADAEGTTPDPEAILHYLRGRERALNGQQLAAIVDLEKARELDPTSTAILRELARGYGLEGNTQKVRELYTELLARDPDDGEALFTLAMNAAAARDFEQAIAFLSRHYINGTYFTHDPADDLLAYHTLHVSLRTLGYDRAALDAAHALTSRDFSVSSPSIYAAYVIAIGRQRDEMLRWIGDLNCRTGAFDEALMAYAQAARFPQSDPAGLQARVLWCHLCRGASFAAGRELLALLTSAAPNISDSHVQLCTLIAQHCDQREIIAEAVHDLYHTHQDSSGLSQAAAVFVTDQKAATLLGEYAARHPDDLAAAGRALRALAVADVSRAVQRTVELCEVSPHHAARYIDHLAVVLPVPIAEVQELAEPINARHAEIKARMLTRGSAIGQAWDVCEQARTIWPDDRGLELLAISIAGTLDEPAMVQQLINETPHLGNAYTLMMKARACRSVELSEDAITLAQAAVDRARLEQHLLVETLLESARAHAAAATGASSVEQRELIDQAIARAEEALRLSPDRDEPYEVLLALYPNQQPSPQGTNRVHQLVDQLRTGHPGSRLLVKLAIRQAVQQGAADVMLPQIIALVQGDPTDVEALALAVVMYEQLDQVPQAQQWLTNLVHERPADARILEQLVNLMLRHDLADAAESLLIARTSDPFASILLELVARVKKDHQQELQLATARLDRRPVGTRRALQLAAVYRRAGQMDQSLRELRWVLDHSAHSSRRHLFTAIDIAGQLVNADVQRDELIVDLVRASDARFQTIPLVTRMEGMRASYRLDRSETELDAILHAAVHKVPGAHDVSTRGVLPWRELAQRFINEGMPDLAASVLRARLFSTHQFEPGAVALLSSMVVIAEAPQAEAGADRVLDMLLQLDAQGRVPVVPGVEGLPTLVKAMLSASNIFSVLGNTEGSEFLLEELLRIEPSHPMGQNNLGYARIQVGHPDDRIVRRIEEAAVSLPEDVNILDTIGWLRYRQGRFEEAIPLLEASIVGSADPPAESFDHLGDTHWRLGNEDQALEAWQRARDMLADPQREQQILENFALLQQQVWGLVVADPEELYHRAFGILLVRVLKKISAVEADGFVPIAPVFKGIDVRTSGE